MEKPAHQDQQEIRVPLATMVLQERWAFQEEMVMRVAQARMGHRDIKDLREITGSLGLKAKTETKENREVTACRDGRVSLGEGENGEHSGPQDPQARWALMAIEVSQDRQDTWDLLDNAEKRVRLEKKDR